MTITVRVNAHSKRNSVEQLNTFEYKVHVTVVPEHGKANDRVIELLADYFGIAKSKIELLSGQSSKVKRFEVYTN